MVKLKSKTRRKILVTSALPYANGPIHCGHLVEYIQTDIFVRFLRLAGEDVIFICADDTHGAPIEIKAKELGITPEKLIEDVYKEHTRDFSNFLVSFDEYYTTHSPENKYYSDLIFERLNKKGYIYMKEMEVTYCEYDKRTLPDRYVKGTCPKCGAPDQYGDVCERCGATYKTTDLINPYCVICRNTPIRKQAEHYFFRLSSFSERLRKWLDKNKQLQPEIKNFVYSWIKNGLEDWCISRDGPYFGFKIPGEEDKYYYVWLDAPIGYIAATEHYCKKRGLKTEDYWVDRKSRIIHFIGKDIIYFHFLFWPAMLMGSGFNLPFNIPVHGFLTVNGEKMSKSRGTFFTAADFHSKYRPEYLRFYYAKTLARNMSDIDLNFSNFQDSINNELVANLANFCYRVLSFANNNLDSRITHVSPEKKLEKEILKKVKNIEEHYYNLEIGEALKETLAISSLGNKYLQDNQPWNLIKADREKAAGVIGFAADIVKILAIISKPILPAFCAELEKQLNLKELSWKDASFDIKEHALGQAKIVFSKIEIVEAAAAPEKDKAAVFPLNIKVARIIAVEDHPNADKLIVLQIDLGTEKRQIVAGIKQFYSKEELLGKKIVVLTNLKPAMLRGKESNGMLLAGDDGKEIGVVAPKLSEPGDQVYMEGFTKVNKGQITYEDFTKVQMHTKDGGIYYNGKAMKTDKELLSAEKVGDGARIK
ncbi:methionine--tRNA ligase [Candidatus Woesearchaeota archaeon]|nr:methionine--tRNA ligase [Candidatus Woesearchaeota archaeon]